MGEIRSLGRWAIGVLCAISAAATHPADAADQGITGKKLLLKSTSKLVLLSKDPAISIAGSYPIGGSDSSITFDDGTNTVTFALPWGYWSTNSSQTLFKYKNSSAPAGPSPVKIAKVKSGQLKVTAKGLPFPVPNGAATISVVLRLDGGTNSYCMTFAGTGDGSKFLVRDAAAGSCPPTPTPTATRTATATPTATATFTPEIPNIPPPGPSPLRYRDQVFSTVTTTTDVTYGSAINNSGQTVILKLDIYEPTGDTVTERPAIVWVHGGSFCCGNKNSGEIVDEATTFAKKGFFNVSINYRLEPGGCTSITPICLVAIQEAQEDAQTAVRFLRTNQALYGIDETRIAIGGSSAGAITALNVGFNSSEDPTAAVGGAVSISGATILLVGAIDSADAPSLLFHGTADGVVPYSWAVSTWNGANAAGLDSFLTSWAGAGHVPYLQNRTQILDQTTNFLYWELDLANAAQ
jgi:acetyl esterase/lipase